MLGCSPWQDQVFNSLLSLMNQNCNVVKKNGRWEGLMPAVMNERSSDPSSNHHKILGVTNSSVNCGV